MERTKGTIEETISSFDSIINLISTCVIVDLPQTGRVKTLAFILLRGAESSPKANDWHFISAVELDGRCSHCN